jgi:hypothetical protein
MSAPIRRRRWELKSLRNPKGGERTPTIHTNNEEAIFGSERKVSERGPTHSKVVIASFAHAGCGAARSVSAAAAPSASKRSGVIAVRGF